MKLAKQITYDWQGRGPGPAMGEVMRTRTGRCWQVLQARLVEMRCPAEGMTRWKLQAIPLPKHSVRIGVMFCSADEPREGCLRVFPLVWHPHGPRRNRTGSRAQPPGVSRPRPRPSHARPARGKKAA